MLCREIPIFKAMGGSSFQQVLNSEREHFRARVSANAAAARIIASFPGRIGVVLSGGGARGAYEAGVLLAFQDAKLPTHILAASSVGSINAASYAANSSTLVGNAEPLLDSWAQVTPPAVGIDWSRYVFMLAGLIAASAGLFNALRSWLGGRGIYLHARHPVLTWLALMVAGAALLLLYDQLPYVGYVALNFLRGGYWKPDRPKAMRSLAANLLVWGFVCLVLNFTHIHVGPTAVLQFDFSSRILMLVLLALVGIWWFFIRDRVSNLSHKFLRLPLRSGLFPNYERTKYLRAVIPAERLRASPIRVVMTATDLVAGNAKYFTNASQADLLRDPQVTLPFVETEIEQADDLLLAVIASSAFTIAYEAVPMQKRLWTDGGVVTNQPIRPAVRLGADVLFLVMVEPAVSATPVEIRTFLDVGLRAIDILVAKNLIADLKLLGRINSMCQSYAAGVGLRPEQVQVEIGPLSYKFVQAFTICPQSPLGATALDFEGELTSPAILQGYRDGSRSVLDFVDYAAGLPGLGERQVVRLVPEAQAAKASV